jgi:arylsulfatase A-like enzyme
LSGAKEGIQKEDPTIAELLKPLGYTSGQFGKNHLGDGDEHLPTVHGFDEFFGNLYDLNAEEEPEPPDYPKNPGFKQKFGPRGGSTPTPTPTARRESRTPEFQRRWQPACDAIHALEVALFHPGASWVRGVIAGVYQSAGSSDYRYRGGSLRAGFGGF